MFKFNENNVFIEYEQVKIAYEEYLQHLVEDDIVGGLLLVPQENLHLLLVPASAQSNIKHPMSEDWAFDVETHSAKTLTLSL